MSNLWEAGLVVGSYLVVWTVGYLRGRVDGKDAGVLQELTRKVKP